MGRNIKVLTTASYLSMLFLGISTTFVGATARNIDLTPYQIGLFVTVQNVGFMVAVLVSGALADTLEKPRILFVGSLILAVSFFSFYLTGTFWINLIIMTLIGAGTGTYEGVTDAMLLDMHDRRQALHINVNHFFVTFGSIVITLYLIYLQMEWRTALVQSALVVLLLAFIYLATRLRPNKKAVESYWQRIRILTREPLVGGLFFATVMVVGVELGTIGILTTYLMDMREFTQTTSKLGLVTFFTGIAIGRLLIGYFGNTDRIRQTILALFGSAVIVYLALYFVNLGEWSYLTTLLSGLAISALLPLMITLAGQAYPEMAGTVIGSIKVAIPIGGIVLPLALSLLSRGVAFGQTLVVFPIALLLAFVVLFLIFRLPSIPNKANS
jgi:MFS family permease